MPLSPKPCLPSSPIWPSLLLHNHFSTVHEAYVAKQLLFVFTGGFVCALSKVYCTIFGNKMYVHVCTHTCSSLHTSHPPPPSHPTPFPLHARPPYTPFSHTHQHMTHLIYTHPNSNSPHTHLPSPCTHQTRGKVTMSPSHIPLSTKTPLMTLAPQWCLLHCSTFRTGQSLTTISQRIGQSHGLTNQSVHH